MLNKIVPRTLGLSILLALLPTTAFAVVFSERQEVKEFIDEVVSEQKLDREQINNLFSKIESSPEIIQKITTPYEALPWDKYRSLFLSEQKIAGGLKFWQEYKKDLDAAQQKYGVPAELIVAIIGVESAYGQNRGKYLVLQALATLAFDYAPRAKFFRTELKEYLALTVEHQLDPMEIKGSYAGAMGIPQFISSSYRNFAVDFDGTSKVDLINNIPQAICSVANYFKVHGWQTGQAVVLKAKARGDKYRALQVASKNDPKAVLSLDTLKQHDISSVGKIADKDTKVSFLQFESGPNNQYEYWLGLNNFYVITRYNHSSNYAMAVYQLSQAIAKLYKQPKTSKQNSAHNGKR